MEGVEKLLGLVVRTAMQQQALKPSEIAQVNVDTTVQEKAIAFPTDARLYALTCFELALLIQNMRGGRST